MQVAVTPRLPVRLATRFGRAICGHVMTGRMLVAGRTVSMMMPMSVAAFRRLRLSFGGTLALRATLVAVIVEHPRDGRRQQIAGEGNRGDPPAG